MKFPRQPEIRNLFEVPVIFGGLLDEIPIGIAVLDLDRRIVFLNRTMEILTGFSINEARGITCYHILRNRVCAKECPALMLQKDSESVSLESDIINRDRRLIPVKVSLSTLKDMKNNVVGFMETAEDLRSIRALDAEMSQAFSLSHVIGRSPKMQKILQILPAFAQTDSSVLITGETGTGKDLVAEAIHQASDRAQGPFIKINCGALPESLMESELFGHQKGSFTGAVNNKPGRFKLAHGGTLFLTEIGDLPLALQIKLLTFLDDKVIYPLGSSKGFPVDVRIIAATHRNLEQMVQNGRFRKDLLFRLNVVRLQLPPLREREDDIRLLLNHFFKSFTSRFQKAINNFSKETLDVLLHYNYPGNVRELRNIVEYAVNICQEKLIQIDHLPAYLLQCQTAPNVPRVESIPDDTAAESPSLPARYSVRHRQSWSDLERQMILEALIKAGGKRSKAAEILGWGRTTLWRKIKTYELD